MKKHTKTAKSFPNYPLAELHAHLGTSISPATLWQIAHDQGIKLPKKEFEEFRDYIMLSPERKLTLNEYFEQVYHPLLDPLSSGIHAVERATYHTMAGAYREGGISLMELRNNPMKHNGDSKYDLDHIIMAMLHGMERALLEYKKLRAGLIFCMAREFSVKQNAIILEKAIKYRRRGVVAIDIAGPAVPGFQFKEHAHLFEQAHKAGLGVTVHTGEIADANDMWAALEYAKPQRIGHGIRAAYDVSLMRELARRKVVLEICPMSNIVTKAVSGLDEMKFILRTFIEHDVPFCINTDWSEVIEDGHLRLQFDMLYKHKILNKRELAACNRTAAEASFIPERGGIEAYL